jgi:hypothetical protein
MCVCAYTHKGLLITTWAVGFHYGIYLKKKKKKKGNDSGRDFCHSMCLHACIHLSMYTLQDLMKTACCLANQDVKKKRYATLHSLVHPLTISFANQPLDLWDTNVGPTNPIVDLQKSCIEMDSRRIKDVKKAFLKEKS